MTKNSEFFIHTSDTDKKLVLDLAQSGDAAEAVDRAMADGKHPQILEICGMDQAALEHFVTHYAGSYRYLSFFKCQLIRDFSPLEELQALEEVSIYWNIRADRLWNFSRNDALRTLSVADAKRITLQPNLLTSSKTLEDVTFSGSIFNNYPMKSLTCFEAMSELRRLTLNGIRLQDHNFDALKTLPKLERFDFDAGMLTTEELAWIVAKFPNLSGKSLCAYNKDGLSDVRICGTRKPGLRLPREQKRLEKYTAQFNALVEQYRNEP